MSENREIAAPNSRYWVIIPAAGAGRRMQADVPKQYLPLRGRTVLEYALAPFCAHPAIEGAVLAVAAGDDRWQALRPACEMRLEWVEGGAERCHSVLNALNHLRAIAAADDWVMVHDAARPCLRRSDLDVLIDTLRNHPVGGLLGNPVRDTMKRTDAERGVFETLDRDTVWHALTPQMFRFQVLHEALLAALDGGTLVTDESAAVELRGLRPLMIEGHADNIKITRPEDLPLAEFYLERQHNLAALDSVTLDDGQ